MCANCLTVTQRHYPDLSDSDISQLLWEATAFPFGSSELIEKQLIELRGNTDGTLGGAIAYANNKLDQAMANRVENEP